MNPTYKRPYCPSCRLIWGKSSIGRVFKCNKCGSPLILKSFNPWLKALIGIAIVAGGLATMAIPGFPVFWIGGLLFGPIFMFNGLSQWLKIRQLDAGPDRPPPSERPVPAVVLTCRKCGQKNRVNGHSPGLRPICGNCRAPLRGSLLSVLARHASRFAPAVLGVCVFVGVIAVLVASRYFFPPATVPPLDGYYPLLTPMPRSHLAPPSDISRPVATRVPELNRRLPNGTLIRFGNLNGSGRLKVDNGLSYDAVAKLVDPTNGLCTAYFCVSAGAAHTLTSVPDGAYRLLFAAGEDWDPLKGFFTRPGGASEFSQRLSFETRRRYEGTSEYTEYSEVQVTFHPVPQGAARTHTVSTAEFEKF